MIKKGIILAGGMGTRMSPLTKAVNKQLLPIYDKPLIFYPLSILMLAKIKDILIIVNKGQLNQYKKLIPNGDNLGIKISYIEQDKPRGLPDAFVLGEKFIGKDKIAMISSTNRTEWNLVDIGLLAIGAVNVPIYPTISSEDYEYILNHSESQYCFVSDQEVYDKVVAIKDKVKSLKKIYSFDSIKGCSNWKELLKMETSSDQDGELKKRKSASLNLQKAPTHTPRKVIRTPAL